jgi:hypothetical protein
MFNLYLTPAETTNFMILGLGFILGTTLIYVVSLIVRTRNMNNELELLKDLEPGGE